MKIKFFFIQLFFLFMCFSKVFPVATGQGYLSYKINKEKLNEILTEDEKKDLKKIGLRYIEVEAAEEIKFDKSAFYSSNYFYLGASSILDIETGESALMRAYVTLGSTPSENTVSFATMAPEKVYLNGATERENNPLYKNKITNLELMYRYPVVTLSKAVSVDSTNFAANKLVCLVNDVDSGGSVTTNTEKINDGNGAESDGVVGLAASSSKIFAAVKPNGGDFGVANSGIALLIQNEKKLEPVNAKTGVITGNEAFKIDLDADVLLAITQAAKVGGLGNMHWDSSLSRLYIALTGVERDDNSNAGGVISLLVGRLDENTLTIESVVGLNLGNFEINDLSYIFGFYYTDATDVLSHSYKVKTMHTSTGKSYVIVNGGVYTDDVNNQVYALPVVKSASSGAGSTAANVGKIAKKSDLTAVVASKNDMTLSTEDAAKVGNGTLPIANTQAVQGMFVVGDSVFICVAGARNASGKEAGIFRSTAIFDGDGIIRAWTSWQRVMGNVDKVFGAGLDTTLGNYWYFTGTDKDTVKVTQWGKSVVQSGLMGNGLVSLMSSEFTQANAGVHQIFDFDSTTSGFEADEFSMMVATGYEKVALIESGKGGPFVPTSEFTKDTNVFVFNDAALVQIGPICCAEVSRIKLADKGWLFVGGYNGVAVLRKADGKGWVGLLSQLSGAGFPGSGYSFKKLTKSDGSSFSQVYKLVCDGQGEFLYIMTADKLYRVKASVDKFKDTGADVLAEKEISGLSGKLLNMIIFYRATNTRLLVATTTGLYYSNDINDTDEKKTPTWTSVKLSSNTNLSGPIVHLDFVSVQKGGINVDGNLYVLAADLSLDLATIYRFNVKNGSISSITESAGTDYFYSIGELRTNLKSDGSFCYHMLSKHFGQINFLKKINIGSNQTTMRAYENSIDLDLDTDAHNVGVMIQNTASGGWVVPGDWGIRVNE